MNRLGPRGERLNMGAKPYPSHNHARGLGTSIGISPTSIHRTINYETRTITFETRMNRTRLHEIIKRLQPISTIMIAHELGWMPSQDTKTLRNHLNVMRKNGLIMRENNSKMGKWRLKALRGD